MKKKLTILILALVLCLCAAADTAQPDEKLFEKAREAVLLSAEGRYSDAVTLMGMKIKADEMKAAVDVYVNGADKEQLSHNVTVAWLNEGVWYMAVPVILPQDNMVPAFVFTLSGKDTCEKVEVLTWREVEIEYKQAGKVIWNKEYKPGFIVVMD